MKKTLDLYSKKALYLSNKNKEKIMNWKSEMTSFRFLMRNKINGKTMSFTDHVNINDTSKTWYITSVMKRMFSSKWNKNYKVVRVSKDVSGLGRRFKMVYSESKGWVGADLTKTNPYKNS
jgi:hypothetical protein|tara:strand:- start:1685 stop:2044 length:360 start_codon:yes stop_codon:yes gene_type:complete